MVLLVLLLHEGSINVYSQDVCVESVTLRGIKTFKVIKATQRKIRKKTTFPEKARDLFDPYFSPSICNYYTDRPLSMVKNVPFKIP